MKVLTLSVLMLTLLAGCTGTPSKEAAIEDRAIKTTPADTAKAAPAEKPAVATTAKPADAVVTSSSAIQPITSKPVVENKQAAAVETRGVAAPSAEVKGITTEAKPATTENLTAVGGEAKNGTQPGTDLPYSGGTNPADLKDPKSPLSKRRVMFDYDSAAIRDEYRGLLEAHAQYLKGTQSAKVILQGNTDERGSREYNLALGQRRAESVFKALNLMGVPDGQMEAVSLGEEKPVAEGHEEAAWTQNRRTEILYQGD